MGDEAVANDDGLLVANNEREEWMYQPRLPGEAQERAEAYDIQPQFYRNVNEIRGWPSFAFEAYHKTENDYLIDLYGEDVSDEDVLYIFRIRYSRENYNNAEQAQTVDQLKNDPKGWADLYYQEMAQINPLGEFNQAILPGENALPEGSRLYDVAGAIMMMNEINDDDYLLAFLRDLAGTINFDCAEDLFCEEHIYPNRDRSKKVRLSFSDVVVALKMRKQFKASQRFQQNEDTRERIRFFKESRDTYIFLEEAIEVFKTQAEMRMKGEEMNENLRIEFNRMQQRTARYFERNETRDLRSLVAKKNQYEESAYLIALSAISQVENFPRAYFLNPRFLDEPGPGKELDFRVAVLMTKDEQLSFSDFKVILKPSVTSAINAGMRLMNGAYSMANGSRFENTIQRFVDLNDEILNNYNLRNFLLESVRVKYRLEKINNSISRTDQAMRDIWDDQKLVFKSMTSHFLSG